MPDDELDLMRAELNQTRTERDTARRELSDLRAWLGKELEVIRRSPGPEGLTVLSVAGDKEIVAAVVQLRAEVDALKQPSRRPLRERHPHRPHHALRRRGPRPPHRDPHPP
ncbi:hypothetical protein ACFV4M_09315, partial [Kitasatospora indigofera]|uniref:hypothetical protein n=1 Tax=Kitasatospora indigofera TaxID=67307 RepID=UPI00365F5BB1